MQDVPYLSKQLAGTLPYPIRVTSGMAIASFTCGVISFILIPLLCGIAAVITGHIAIKQSSERIEERDLAIAGLILGYLNILLWVGVIIFVIVVLGRSDSSAPSAFVMWF